MKILKSLTIQTMLIIALSLVLTYSFSLLFYSKDRLDALIYLGLKNTALTASHFAHTVAVSELVLRQGIIDNADQSQMYVSLSNVPAFEQTKNQTEYEIAFNSYLSSGAHGNDFTNQIFSLSEDSSIRSGGADQEMLRSLSPHFLQFLYSLPMHLTANVAVKLENDQWLNISLPLPDYPSELWSPALMPVGLFTFGLILISGWTVRRILKPLTDVTRAAREFAQNIDAPHINPGSSPEAQAVAEAFNEMQRKIKAIIRSRTEMMGAISHDFRTPLTLIKLRAEGLSESKDRDRLLDSIGRMEVIIDESLLFAKQTYGGEAKRKIDVAALLQSICDDLTEAGHNVAFLTPPVRVVTMGNPVALRRVFTNLLDNALKYGGDVQATVEADKCYALVKIIDDGPGISTEELDRVFDPFYRCDHARTENATGSGLGLSLVKSVVEDHGGEIYLENKMPTGFVVNVQLKVWKIDG